MTNISSLLICSMYWRVRLHIGPEKKNLHIFQFSLPVHDPLLVPVPRVENHRFKPCRVNFSAKLYFTLSLDALVQNSWQCSWPLFVRICYNGSSSNSKVLWKCKIFQVDFVSHEYLRLLGKFQDGRFAGL